MSALFWKAVLAFLALPGVVAFGVPLLLLKPAAASIAWPGALAAAAGVVLLLWCVWEFYAAGKGTLAPWSPPRSLVTSGPYRWSRNPMYVAVILVLWGWAAGFQSRTLATYALAVMLAFHLRVVFGEEPWLARQHGEQWERYKRAVPRWLGPL
jgi:protein-S-isoprenylcysteine O-methyltransferase Ste14